MCIDIVQLLLSIIFVLWLLATGIPGFNLYDGTSSGPYYTHSMWWIAFQFIILIIGAYSTRFPLHYVGFEKGTGQKHVEKGVEPVLTVLLFYMYVLGCGLVAFVTHAAFTFMELNVCNGKLCTEFKWALIMTLVFLCIHPFVHALQIYFVYRYRASLKWALTYDKVPFEFATVVDEESVPVEMNYMKQKLHQTRTKTRRI
jgi:hypothetical protein